MNVCRIFFLLILAGLISCSQESEKQMLLSKVRHSHISDQEEFKGFQCSSTGSRGDGEKLTHLSIGFDTKKNLTINNARQLIVDGVLGLTRHINSEDRLKAYFVDWPVTVQNIEYTVHSVTNNGYWRMLPDGPGSEKNISYINYHLGKIEYRVKINKDTLSIAAYTESLDEAIAILKAEGWKEPTN